MRYIKTFESFSINENSEVAQVKTPEAEKVQQQMVAKVGEEIKKNPEAQKAATTQLDSLSKQFGLSIEDLADASKVAAAAEKNPKLADALKALVQATNEAFSYYGYDYLTEEVDFGKIKNWFQEKGKALATTLGVSGIFATILGFACAIGAGATFAAAAPIAAGALAVSALAIAIGGKKGAQQTQLVGGGGRNPVSGGKM